MPVPKRKRSRSRRDKRFANKGLKIQAITECKNCQEALMPHTVCKGCGFYKGIKILTTKAERAGKRSEAKSAKSARLGQQAPEAAPAVDESK
ncbi:50S ribosomal protein L32 [Candidatus Dependentiae bacterium]|nr:50S ribosomal protein L32 [Candidatus Dependentiae bacterium]